MPDGWRNMNALEWRVMKPRVLQCATLKRAGFAAIALGLEL
jgi:hypothetical protein